MLYIQTYRCIEYVLCDREGKLVAEFNESGDRFSVTGKENDSCSSILYVYEKEKCNGLVKGQTE